MEVENIFFFATRSPSISHRTNELTESLNFVVNVCNACAKFALFVLIDGALITFMNHLVAILTLKINFLLQTWNLGIQTSVSISIARQRNGITSVSSFCFRSSGVNSGKSSGPNSRALAYRSVSSPDFSWRKLSSPLKSLCSSAR